MGAFFLRFCRTFISTVYGPDTNPGVLKQKSSSVRLYLGCDSDDGRRTGVVAGCGDFVYFYINTINEASLVKLAF